jgi:hypothetical protein
MANLHPAAQAALFASPRSGVYIGDDDAALIAAAVLRWLDANAETWVYEPGSLAALADEIAPQRTESEVA